MPRKVPHDNTFLLGESRNTNTNFIQAPDHGGNMKLALKSISVAQMPKFSPARKQTKAEKFATDFFNRKKEMDEEDAFKERLAEEMNIPLLSNHLTPVVHDAVNVSMLRGRRREIGINTDAPMATGVGVVPIISLNKAKASATSQKDDIVQSHPLTGEVSTTSSQTINNMVDATTSPVQFTSEGGTQTDEPGAEDVANMVVDPPLTQIVNNYNSTKYNSTNMINNFIEHNEYQYQQSQIINTLNQQQTTINNLLHQRQLNMIYNNDDPMDPSGIPQHVPPSGSAAFPMQQDRITYPDILMIEGSPNEVAVPDPIQLQQLLPPANGNGDELPAYGDLDMDFGEMNLPPAYQPRRKRPLQTVVMPGAVNPPAYQRLNNPNNRRARIPEDRRRGAANTAARILERQRDVGNRIVNLPNVAAVIPYEIAPDVPEYRIRDEGWFMQGIDNVPKPPTKRKGARLVKDEKPKRRRLY